MEPWHHQAPFVGTRVWNAKEREQRKVSQEAKRNVPSDFSPLFVTWNSVSKNVVQLFE